MPAFTAARRGWATTFAFTSNRGGGGSICWITRCSRSTTEWNFFGGLGQSHVRGHSSLRSTGFARYATDHQAVLRTWRTGSPPPDQGVSGQILSGHGWRLLDRSLLWSNGFLLHSQIDGAARWSRGYFSGSDVLGRSRNRAHARIEAGVRGH